MRSRKLSGRLTLVAASTMLVLVLAVAPVRAEEEEPEARPAAESILARQSLGGFGSGGGVGSLFGWFDKSRLSWNQSFQMGFSSGSGYRGPAGLYTSSFGYRLANPLNLRVDIGAHYTPGGNGFSNPQASAGLFVQGVTLDWRPGGNSLVRFSYQNLQSPLQYGYGFANPYQRYSHAPIASPDDPSFGEPPSGN
jgi:hypothetical protein